MRFRRFLQIFLISVVILTCRASPAYNFLYIHPTSGQPIVWKPGAIIQYYLDPGSLGSLTNDQLRTLVEKVVKVWENASPNAGVPHFEFAGYLPEDVDGTNYSKYVSLFQCYTEDLSSCASEAQMNLQTVIVFDDDGSILADELCRIGACLASAGAKVFSGSASNPGNIVQGIAVFGQGFVGGVDAAQLAASLAGTMVHELGHLLGLAHGSVNQQAEGSEVLSIPTMTTPVSWLLPDDIAGISVLYPSDSFAANTARIEGQILKSDGTPMMHVNVIARNVGDPLCEAYSWLSGRICPPDYIGTSTQCFDSEFNEVKDGKFIVSGIPPGTYTVEVEEVADDSLGLTLAPGLLPSEDIFGDAEFWNEGDVADESSAVSSVITLAAGETRDGINIILNRSEVTSDRVPYIPINTFTPGPGTLCPSGPTVDYAELIGVEEFEDPGETAGTTGGSASSGGCSLVLQ